MGPQQELDDLVSAAREAQGRLDWAAAYRSLKRARDLGSLEADDLSTLALASWWLGFTKENLMLTEELHHSLLDRGDIDRAALNALDVGLVWMMRGDLAIGSGWVSRARRLLEGRPVGAAHGYLRYVDVETALGEHDLEAALAGAHDMQQMGHRFAVPTLVALGLMFEGIVRIRRGDVPAGFALLDEAMLPVLADQVAPDWAGSVYCNTMLICHELADVRRAREWNDATELWCRQVADPVMFTGICRLHRVQLLVTEGAWDEAEAEAQRVSAELADLNIAVVAESEYQIGELRRLRGDLEGSAQAFGRARSLGREPQPGESLLLLAQGRGEAARDGINAALAQSGADPFRRIRLLRAQVEIGLACSDVTAAARAVDELQALTGCYASPGFHAWALHARGSLELVLGNAEQARPVLQEACREYAALTARHDMARVQVLLSRASRVLGEKDMADALMRSAAATFDRLGVRADVRRTAIPAQRAPGGLTAREAEVLAHIAGGGTNKDVAAALFISERTVGRHLANIFGKIGVSSRTAAAAWALKRGLTAVPPSVSASSDSSSR